MRAWEKINLGLQPETRKEWPNNEFWPHGENRAQKLGRFLFQFWGHFSDLLGEADIYCSAIFSFRAGGPKWILSRLRNFAKVGGVLLEWHVCRVKLPPEYVCFNTRNGTKNTKNDPENDPKRLQVILSPSLAATKNISRALSQIAHCPRFVHKIQIFFSR